MAIEFTGNLQEIPCISGWWWLWEGKGEVGAAWTRWRVYCMTAEDCEAAGKSTFGVTYWNQFTPFQGAKYLWPEEVAKIEKG